MRISSRPNLRRIGFTLVELLVVIAIIAVLVGLIVPASMNILKKGPQVATTAEISGMQTAANAFLMEFKVKHIPSKIMLCEKIGDYGAGQLDIDSRDYLLQLWPSMQTKWQTGIDWNGDGGYTPPVVLEGDQCLVFFLGGVPLRNPFGCYGFATDQSDPVKLSQAQGRKGPYFTGFQSDRLRPRAGSGAAASGYLSYYDPYSSNDPTRDKPYAFFSGYGRKDYLKYGPAGDCPSLGVTPYMEGVNPPRFHNATTFQIISAGANKTFGPGGLWSPATATQVPAAGADDQSNFYGSLLGVGN